MSKTPTSDLPSGHNETSTKKKKRQWKREAIKLEAELATAREEIEVLQERLAQLQVRYKSLEAAGLDERHQVKLRRLEHLAGRIINMQVCETCEKKKEAVLEDLKFIK